ILGLAAFGLGVLPVLVALKVGAPGSGVLVDALAYVIAVGFLSRISFAGDRLLGVAGPPLAVVVLAIGLSSLRHTPLDAAVRARAGGWGPRRGSSVAVAGAPAVLILRGGMNLNPSPTYAQEPIRAASAASYLRRVYLYFTGGVALAIAGALIALYAGEPVDVGA